MKKYLVMMLCAGMLFAATGCGDEKKEEKSDSNTETKQQETAKDNQKEKGQVLKCSTDSSSYMKAESKFTYDKDGKTIQAMSANYEFDFDEDEISKITDEELDSFCKEFEQLGSTSCEAKLKGNKVIAAVELDVNELEDQSDNEFTRETSIEELKELMEEKDLTCEIEK